MSPAVTALVEWGATLLSLAGFWLCIRHRPACFLFFFVADAAWFASAWAHFHPALLAQQGVYLVLNAVGYALWRKDEELKKRLEALESRELKDPAAALGREVQEGGPAVLPLASLFKSDTHELASRVSATTRTTS